MPIPRIKNTAILIGYGPDGKCVYSEILDIRNYYDDEHIWDNPARAKRLKLQRLKGYLFNPAGKIDQEFENAFDLLTGKYLSGRTRYADGTIRTDP